MDLLEVCWWSMDLSSLRSRAEELRVLGERLDRADLQTVALRWLAPTVAADGDPDGCIALGEEAMERGLALEIRPPPMVHTYLSMPYYWLGRIDDAVTHARAWHPHGRLITPRPRCMRCRT